MSLITEWIPNRAERFPQQLPSSLKGHARKASAFIGDRCLRRWSRGGWGILIAVVLLALGVTAEAQQPKKVLRIRYLSALVAARESTWSEGFQLALRERG